MNKLTIMKSISYKEKTETIKQGHLWDTYDENKKQELLLQADIYQKLSNQKIEAVNYKGIEIFATTSLLDCCQFYYCVEL